MKDMTKIENLRDAIDENSNKYPGMTYEQGIAAALDWVLDDIKNATDIYER